jgi:hypothetical protein
MERPVSVVVMGVASFLLEFLLFPGSSYGIMWRIDILLALTKGPGFLGSRV